MSVDEGVDSLLVPLGGVGRFGRSAADHRGDGDGDAQRVERAKFAFPNR
jgi:hypothetical protein